MHLYLKSIDRSSNFLTSLMLKTVMLTVLVIKIGNFPSQKIFFPLSGRALWKISTDPKQRTLMRISCLHNVSRLPRTWLHSCSSAS